MFIILCLLFWWCQSQRIKETDFLKQLPTPHTNLPFFGVALDFTSSKEVLNVLNNYTKTCGSLFGGRIGPFETFVVVADHKMLEFILSNSHFNTKSEDYDFFHPWLGTGLLTSDGPKWKKHRRILTPAFHFQILEQFIDVFEKCGNILIKKLEKKINEKSINIYTYITLCSLDIICESIMGISINAQLQENSEYVQSVKNMCRIIIERATSLTQKSNFLFPLSKNYWTQKHALKILHKQSNEVILIRKKELEKKLQNNDQTNGIYSKNKKPFLDLLLQTKINEQPLTQEEIREEVDTFMFEGHDTTSSAISFILYSLANNPDVQKKAVKEQQEIFENKIDSLITYADLQKMKYLECVIKESLRLYASVPFYGRKVTQNIEYENGIIPKGVTIVIFAFGIHRNSNYYDNPEKFIPERFENNSGKLPYAFIPFSAGPRNCIGQKFAMLEMKSVVSKVLRKFELAPAVPNENLQLVAETILKSSNGINIRLKLRR